MLHSEQLGKGKMEILLGVYALFVALSIAAMRKVNPGEAINDVILSVVWPVTLIFYLFCWAYRGTTKNHAN